MKATALCVRLVMKLLLFLAEHHHSSSQKAVAVFPLVVPNQQQHFERQSVSFDCEGFGNSSLWRVWRKLGGAVAICGSSWATSSGPCTITPTSTKDSGEYWCGADGGRRSSAVNITVTAGNVILEIPAAPVTEANNVTLRCRRRTSSNIIADFYKDAVLIRSRTAGSMTIFNVSKSDEGLYKCRVRGVGESPESLMSVEDGAVILESPALPVMEGHTVTLRCRNNKNPSYHIADFYKNSLHIKTSYSGQMTIFNVSKSDEGLYKCRISAAGDSAESWLAVEAFQEDSPDECPPCGFTILRIFGTTLLVALGLVVGLLHCKKNRRLDFSSLLPSSPMSTIRSLRDPRQED